MFKEPIRVTGSSLNDCMAEVTVEMRDVCEEDLCFWLICQCPDRRGGVEMFGGYWGLWNITVMDQSVIAYKTNFKLQTQK